MVRGGYLTNLMDGWMYGWIITGWLAWSNANNAAGLAGLLAMLAMLSY